MNVPGYTGLLRPIPVRTQGRRLHWTPNLQPMQNLNAHRTVFTVPAACNNAELNTYEPQVICGEFVGALGGIEIILPWRWKTDSVAYAFIVQDVA